MMERKVKSGIGVWEKREREVGEGGDQFHPPYSESPDRVNEANLGCKFVLRAVQNDD